MAGKREERKKARFHWLVTSWLIVAAVIIVGVGGIILFMNGLYHKEMRKENARIPQMLESSKDAKWAYAFNGELQTESESQSESQLESDSQSESKLQTESTEEQSIVSTVIEKEETQTTKKSELLTKNEEKVFIRTVDFLEKLWIELRGETGSEDKTENNKAVEISEKDTYERAKTAFATEADSLETQTEYISQTLQNVFDFMEAAFGDSQEMVAFITELNANFYSIWFIRENGSDQYYRHNKGLLFDDRQKLILGQMEELENTMKRGLKN